MAHIYLTPTYVSFAQLKFQEGTVTGIEALDSGHLCLEDQVRFVEFLAYDSTDLNELTWRTVRLQKTNIWLDTWRQISESRDEKFDAADVPMINIAPPAGSGLPSGASPEDVKDPKMRVEFGRSLAGNRTKIVRFNEQQFIRMNVSQFYEEAERYLVNAYSKPPSDPGELDRLLIEKRRYTMPDTKYEKRGAASSIKDLKIGVRVVIHAAKMNDKLMANEVSFGAVAHPLAKP